MSLNTSTLNETIVTTETPDSLYSNPEPNKGLTDKESEQLHMTENPPNNTAFSFVESVISVSPTLGLPTVPIENSHEQATHIQNWMTTSTASENERLFSNSVSQSLLLTSTFDANEDINTLNNSETQIKVQASSTLDKSIVELTSETNQKFSQIILNDTTAKLMKPELPVVCSEEVRTEMEIDELSDEVGKPLDSAVIVESTHENEAESPLSDFRNAEAKESAKRSENRLEMKNMVAWKEFDIVPLATLDERNICQNVFLKFDEADIISQFIPAFSQNPKELISSFSQYEVTENVTQVNLMTHEIDDYRYPANSEFPNEPMSQHVKRHRTDSGTEIPEICKMNAECSLPILKDAEIESTVCLPKNPDVILNDAQTEIDLMKLPMYERILEPHSTRLEVIAIDHTQKFSSMPEKIKPNFEDSMKIDSETVSLQRKLLDTSDVTMDTLRMPRKRRWESHYDIVIQVTPSKDSHRWKLRSLQSTRQQKKNRKGTFEMPIRPRADSSNKRRADYPSKTKKKWDYPSMSVSSTMATKFLKTHSVMSRSERWDKDLVGFVDDQIVYSDRESDSSSSSNESAEIVPEETLKPVKRAIDRRARRSRGFNVRQKRIEMFKKIKSGRVAQNLTPESDSDSSSSSGIMNLDRDLRSFVVDDDTQDLKTSAYFLPDEYKSETTETRFKVLVQFLVLLTLNATFSTVIYNEKNEEHFQPRITALEKLVNGHRNSLSSNAWRGRFKNGLDRFWKRSVKEISSIKSCEACGKGNHLTTHQLLLEGTPYNAKTLMVLSKKEMESHGLDSKFLSQKRKKQTVDLDGNETVSGSDSSSSKEKFTTETEADFHLGSACYSRAILYHRLVHFKRDIHSKVNTKMRAIAREKKLATKFGETKVFSLKSMEMLELHQQADMFMEEFEKVRFVDELYRNFIRLLDRAQSYDSVDAKRYRR